MGTGRSAMHASASAPRRIGPPPPKPTRPPPPLPPAIDARVTATLLSGRALVDQSISGRTLPRNLWTIIALELGCLEEQLVLVYDTVELDPFVPLSAISVGGEVAITVLVNDLVGVPEGYQIVTDTDPVMDTDPHGCLFTAVQTAALDYPSILEPLASVSELRTLAAELMDQRGFMFHIFWDGFDPSGEWQCEWEDFVRLSYDPCPSTACTVMAVAHVLRVRIVVTFADQERPPTLFDPRRGFRDADAEYEGATLVIRFVDNHFQPLRWDPAGGVRQAPTVNHWSVAQGYFRASNKRASPRRILRQGGREH